MKPGFYISMGVAITGLAVGFILLYDIQQEKESQNIWIQKIPKQCNDVWYQEFNEFYQINSEIKEVSKEELKKILEEVIETHYEKIGITVLEINLELDYYDAIRCEACDCLGWDKLSIKIPQEQLNKIPQDEDWEQITN